MADITLVIASLLGDAYWLAESYVLSVYAKVEGVVLFVWFDGPSNLLGLAYKLRDEIRQQVFGRGANIASILKDPSPRDIVFAFAVVYWAYRLIKWASSSILPKLAGRRKAAAGSDASPAKTEEEGLAFLSSVPRQVGSKTKFSHKKKARKVKSQIAKYAKTFLFYAFFYFGVPFATGGSNADSAKWFVSNQLRDSATDLIKEILPRPSWHREPLVSWLRVFGVGAALYVFFVWILESGSDVIIKGAAAEILYETLGMSLALLHLEDWQSYVPKLAFVFYWRYAYGNMIAFAIFVMKFGMDLCKWLGTKAEERLSAPYSYVAPWLLRLPLMIPISFSIPLWMTTWTQKKVMYLHKNKDVLRYKKIWGISAKQTYYQILGVPENASDKAIKKAFRDHSRKLHPDKNPDPNAQELFMKIKDAYNNLIKKGSWEDMRMQQLENNQDDLMMILNLMITGMPYLIGFAIYTLTIVFQLVRWFAVRDQTKRYQAKNAYLRGEFAAFLESRACIELYARSGKGGFLKDQATRWLHPLKKAMAHKAKTSFKHDMAWTDDDLREALANFKKKALKTKTTKGKPKQSQRMQEEEEAKQVLAKLPDLEKQVEKLVGFGLVHRLEHLLHKKILLEVFREFAKKDDSLDAEVRKNANLFFIFLPS